MGGCMDRALDSALESCHQEKRNFYCRMDGARDGVDEYGIRVDLPKSFFISK
jgi:hypothetical protein